MSRNSLVERKTNETSVKITMNLDGVGNHTINTGVGFFDHMLAQLSAHGLIDLEVEATGDIHVDFHHTVEDVGIALGQGLREALGDMAGITRYGEATVPMDESLAQAVVDLSGRSHLVYDDTLGGGKVGEMDVELIREFFEAFVRNSNVTLHVRVLSGRNAHHVIEAIFKAVARALRIATEPDPRREGIPSTKGTL
jgi:imidazoleglycerol-phosphate dehydratase